MRSLLILGAGRSGTSMTAGLFRESGAYMGEDSHPPRAANPFGFFEDAAINKLNDRIILRMLQKGWRRWLWRFGTPLHRHPYALWLAAPRSLPRIEIPDAWSTAIREAVGCEPFCLKDPRFGLTLPVWRPHLPARTRFLVVFRDPDTTVDSMLRESGESYSRPIPLSEAWAYRSWYRMYRRLLEDLSRRGEWLFVRYETILSGEAIPALEAFAETKLCLTQIRPEVARARPRPSRLRAASHARRLLCALIARAERDAATWGGGSRV